VVKTSASFLTLLVAHAPMCTLIAAFQQHPGVPLLVAANRDEVKDRPATGPRRWPGEAFVAPRDERALGTWLGLTRSGLFVGVTNRFPSDKHPERESRGALVVDALRAGSAKELHGRLSTLPPRRYNAFHLLYADADAAFVTWSDGEALHQHQLAPGLHVVTERSLGGDDHARRSLILQAWPGLSVDGALPTPEALQGLLALRRPGEPLGSVCVDVPELNYGTRSALVLYLSQPVTRSRLYWADGPPDRASFVERADLLRGW
jgi:uncharacterized protein with NRDE domain